MDITKPFQILEQIQRELIAAPWRKVIFTAEPLSVRHDCVALVTMPWVPLWDIPIISSKAKCGLCGATLTEGQAAEMVQVRS